MQEYRYCCTFSSGLCALGEKIAGGLSMSKEVPNQKPLLGTTLKRSSIREGHGRKELIECKRGGAEC